jgi:two-component system sensor histidine kinase VicK
MKAAIEPGELTCLGDRARLVQVLQNLIRNAIRFTHEGGIILVGARPDGDRVALYVQDTGIGISPEDLPFVFDRFYRSDRSRSRSGGGAGLGLAIARQLVEQMDGQLSVASDVGEGSTFTISLKRASAGATPAKSSADTVATGVSARAEVTATSLS